MTGIKWLALPPKKHENLHAKLKETFDLTPSEFFSIHGSTHEELESLPEYSSYKTGLSLIPAQQNGHRSVQRSPYCDVGNFMYLPLANEIKRSR